MGIVFSGMTTEDEDAARKKFAELAFGPTVSANAAVALAQIALNAPDPERPAVAAAKPVKAAESLLEVTQGSKGPRFVVKGSTPLPVVRQFPPL